MSEQKTLSGYENDGRETKSDGSELVHEFIDVDKKPAEWRVVEIGKICRIQSGGTPLRSVRDFYGGDIPWMKIGDITRAGKFIDDVEEYITRSALENSSARIFPEGTVFLAMYGSIGKVTIGAKPLSCNQAILGIQCPDNILDKEFLYYWLVFNKKKYLCRGQETTQSNLNAIIVKQFLIPLPPLSEQQKISAILSSIDYTIQKTQSIVEQTQKLKRGLMQKLLTKGIGHTKFKKTEIGEIPEEWKILELGGMVKFIRSGVSRQLSSYDIGIPVIRSKNIEKNRLDLTDTKYWYLDDPQGVNLTDYVLDDRDILLNFINSIDQIGKCCLFAEQERDYIYTTNIFRIKMKPNLIIHEYFHFFSQSYMYQSQLNRIIKPAVNQASFTIPDFNKIEIPLPSVSEQKEITSILSSVDERIEKEQHYVTYLENLKRGLMQDLLTGKKRVKV